MSETMKPMLATGYDKTKVKFPCIVQSKLDGVRCQIICLVGGEVRLFSRTGKEYNVPHILKWANEHKDLLPLDGEIYNHNELTFQQICSAVKCKSEWTDKLKFVCYDKPVSDKTNKQRWGDIVFELGDCIEQEHTECIQICETAIAHSYEEIERWHDYFVQKGYEGAIIRNMDGMYIEGRSNNLMKLKKFDTDEYEILWVHEAAGQDAGTALFELRVPDTDMTFHARPVGSKELRAAYLRDKEQLIGKMCTIRHFGFTDGGKIPRFPVALTIRDYE